MSDFDNPATRLLNILQAGRKMNTADPCRNVWHQLLSTNGNEAMLMSRLGKLMTLPGEIVQAYTRHYPDRGSTWSHWFKQVNTAFVSQQLSSNWQTFIGHIDDHTMAYLGMTADMLAHRDFVAKIEAEQLEALRKDVSELLQEALESDLEPKTKDAIARHLQRLLIALDEYAVTGALPVLDAVEGSIGHTAFDQQYAAALKETSIGQRFVTILTTAANVVTVVVGLPQLPAGIHAAVKLLGN
ncbi:hypothetical protein LGM38_17725 [Burkholderia vietnamiensis]|uniref:hypothetical protein n=1 Tax=Burkholderia vietnamiensis TaxID=60552 RepID=UPI001CF316B9|nr:hypothetical protein [Burkholderia vietnamiensis]MCA8013888.1 hypothetical protein [Burkholderia vietnamiensis]HDR8937053.1 hypothetical protein [Burkholderia vietnamiensis]HDR9260540.1 hypothetical protein [Burkholderia vietnamiensis]